MYSLIDLLPAQATNEVVCMTPQSTQEEVSII